MATTTKGFPYPAGTDAVDVAGDIQSLAEAVDNMPGVESLTGAEISALAVADKWAGRVVYNSTTGKLQVSNGSTFSDVDTTTALSSSTPSALGTAAAGSSTSASKSDHVHAMPTASDVAAIPNSLVTAKGQIIGASGSGTPAVVSAGTDGHFLVADSGSTAGAKFANAVTGNLSLTSATAFNPALTMTSEANDANPAYVVFRKNRASAIVQNGDTVGAVSYRGFNGTSYNELAAIWGQVDGTPGASSDMPGRLVFYTTADGAGNLTERMRISQDGTITFANVYAKTVGATNRDLFIDNGGVIGYVSSVRESKTEITPQTDVSWLLDLDPQTFRYRARNEDGNYTDQPDGPTQYGLIAEDVEAVNPDLCFYDETDNGPVLRGVSYSMLVTPLLQLVKQQEARIAALEAAVAALTPAE